MGKNTAHIKFNMTKNFLPNITDRKRMSAFTSAIYIVLKVLARQEKVIQISKEEVNYLYLWVHNHI